MTGDYRPEIIDEHIQRLEKEIQNNERVIKEKNDEIENLKKGSQKVFDSKLIIHEALTTSMETQKMLHIQNASKNAEIEKQRDEIETLNMGYDNGNREINNLKQQNLRLMNENDRLNKTNYKMQGKNQKQGAKVMQLEKELRIHDPSKWKEYKSNFKADKNV